MWLFAKNQIWKDFRCNNEAGVGFELGQVIQDKRNKASGTISGIRNNCQGSSAFFAQPESQDIGPAVSDI